MKLLEILFRWSFRPASDIEVSEAGIIVTQSWSRRLDGRPGKGNIVLAEVTRKYALRNLIPVYPQEEVAQSLRELPDGKAIFIAGMAGGSPDGRSTAEWDTCAVAKIQADYCLQMGVTRALIVAHPLHMNRALWVYEKLGLKVVPAAMPLELGIYCDSGLVHWTARSIYRTPVLLMREVVARLLFWWQGKI